MSIIQSIIASSYVQSGNGSSWIYPPIGQNYPVTGTYHLLTSSPLIIAGYYEGSSIAAPTLGLWRRTFSGMAIENTSMDPNFPGTYSQVQSLADQYVGFGSDNDVATQFTMEWTGYFKPTTTSNFVFEMNVDDYSMMWIGQDAVSGFTPSNSIITCNNNQVATSGAIPLIADKYYPVRIRYTENQGGHNCTVWSGWNGTTLANNIYTAASGQFFYDNGQPIDFPSTGLVI